MLQLISGLPVVPAESSMRYLRHVGPEGKPGLHKYVLELPVDVRADSRSESDILRMESIDDVAFCIIKCKHLAHGRSPTTIPLHSTIESGPVRGTGGTVENGIVRLKVPYCWDVTDSYFDDDKAALMSRISATHRVWFVVTRVGDVQFLCGTDTYDPPSATASVIPLEQTKPGVSRNSQERSSLALKGTSRMEELRKKYGR
jgi:hypothetical protein